MSDLSIEQVAEITNLNTETIRRLCRNNQIPGAYKIGKSWRIRKESINLIRGIKTKGDKQQ